MKNILVELLKVSDLTHDDWNLWIIIIFVKVNHNRIVPSYFGIYERWESLCSGECDMTVVPFHAVEKNSTRSRQAYSLCVYCLGQWYGCAYPMSFYCTHCELFKARTGCSETAWHVVDITGKKRGKKRISQFLAWGKLLSNLLWKVLTNLKYAYIWPRIWEPSLALNLKKWLHDVKFTLQGKWLGGWGPLFNAERSRAQ